MIKKLIVVAMLIATFGVGSLAYAQATSGSSGNKRMSGNRMTARNPHRPRRHRRHRRHGGRKRRSPRYLNPQPLPPE
jgi:Ni/Co efflux regulator RcnB